MSAVVARDLVRQSLQLGAGDLLQPRPHAARELDQADAEPQATVLAAHDEPLLGQRAEQSVDARAVRRHLAGELGDGQAFGIVREHAQDAKAALERQRAVGARRFADGAGHQPRSAGRPAGRCTSIVRIAHL